MDPWLFGGGDINLYRFLANSPINTLDPHGTHIIFLLSETFGCGKAGHGALLIGNYQDGYTYLSFGSGTNSSDAGDNLTIKPFPNIEEAVKFLKSQKYTKYARFLTLRDADAKAEGSVKEDGKTRWGLFTHNCINVASRGFWVVDKTVFGPVMGQTPIDYYNKVVKQKANDSGSIDDLNELSLFDDLAHNGSPTILRYDPKEWEKKK